MVSKLFLRNDFETDSLIKSLPVGDFQAERTLVQKPLVKIGGSFKEHKKARVSGGQYEGTKRCSWRGGQENRTWDFVGQSMQF